MRKLFAVSAKQNLWKQINLGSLPIKTKPKPFETAQMSFPKYFEQMSQIAIDFCFSNLNECVLK